MTRRKPTRSGFGLLAGIATGLAALFPDRGRPRLRLPAAGRLARPEESRMENPPPVSAQQRRQSQGGLSPSRTWPVRGPPTLNWPRSRLTTLPKYVRAACPLPALLSSAASDRSPWSKPSSFLCSRPPRFISSSKAAALRRPSSVTPSLAGGELESLDWVEAPAATSLTDSSWRISTPAVWPVRRRCRAVTSVFFRPSSAKCGGFHQPEQVGVAQRHAVDEDRAQVGQVARPL